MIKLKQSSIDKFLSIYNSIPLNDKNEKLWVNARNRQGYGVFTASLEDGTRKQFHCHRLAWLLLVGDIPEGFVVRHKNDNPADCNIDNLELGTVADNNNDTKSRGRYNMAAAISNLEKAKVKAAIIKRRFSEEDIKNILDLHEKGYTKKYIANLYGVSEKSVYNIYAKRFYKHLTT